MNIWEQIRSNKQERCLFLLALLAAALLLIAEIRPSVWKALSEWVVVFLTSSALKSVVSSISASIVAAYIFYFFVDFFPRLRRRNETLLYLDSLLFIVLDAIHCEALSDTCLPLSTAIPISQQYKTGLTLEYVAELKRKLMDDSRIHSTDKLNPYEQLAQAARNRLPTIGFAISMANELSFSQGLIWSDLTETLRQISIEKVNTLEPMTNDERRKCLMLAATLQLDEWLRNR